MVVYNRSDSLVNVWHVKCLFSLRERIKNIHFLYIINLALQPCKETWQASFLFHRLHIVQAPSVALMHTHTHMHCSKRTLWGCEAAWVVCCSLRDGAICCLASQGGQSLNRREAHCSAVPTKLPKFNIFLCILRCLSFNLLTYSLPLKCMHSVR